MLNTWMLNEKLINGVGGESMSISIAFTGSSILSVTVLVYDFIVDTDGILMPLNVYVVGDSREELLPEAEIISETIPGMDGEIDFGSRLKARILELHCATDDLTPAEKRAFKRNAARYLNPLLEAKSLVFLDDPEKTYLVKYDGKIPLDNAPEWYDFTIPFRMSNPYIIGTYENSLVGSGTITNDGTVETPFVVQIVGPATNPSVTVGSYTITYTGTLASGDVLVIDTEHMTAKVGVSNALANYNGVFPKLQVGDTAVTAGSNVTIKWRNRWI